MQGGRLDQIGRDQQAQAMAISAQETAMADRLAAQQLALAAAVDTLNERLNARLSASAEATLEALRLARAHGKLVSFDVNYRAPLWLCESDAAIRIGEALPFVDLLKVSEEEVHLVGGAAGLAGCLKTHGIALAVETLGAQGARCHFAGETIDVPPVPAVAVDATGAGDAFWGAFLSHLVNHGVSRVGDLCSDLLRDAAAYGTAAGSLCVRSKGAIPALPMRAEILSLIKTEGVR